MAAAADSSLFGKISIQGALESSYINTGLCKLVFDYRISNPDYVLRADWRAR